MTNRSAIIVAAFLYLYSFTIAITSELVVKNYTCTDGSSQIILPTTIPLFISLEQHPDKSPDNLAKPTEQQTMRPQIIFSVGDSEGSTERASAISIIQQTKDLRRININYANRRKNMKGISSVLDRAIYNMSKVQTGTEDILTQINEFMKKHIPFALGSFLKYTGRNENKQALPSNYIHLYSILSAITVFIDSFELKKQHNIGEHFWENINENYKKYLPSPDIFSDKDKRLFDFLSNDLKNVLINYINEKTPINDIQSSLKSSTNGIIIQNIAGECPLPSEIKMTRVKGQRFSLAKLFPFTKKQVLWASGGIATLFALYAIYQHRQRFPWLSKFGF